MRPLRGLAAAASTASLLLLASVGAPACGPAPSGGATGPADGVRSPVGWIAWESNRTGSYRIWIRELAGGAARQLSPDEPGRDHCCAHLSPDGARVAYLSLPGGSRSYLPATTDGALHLIAPDGGGDRVVAAPARNYGEHRAVVWWSPSRLVYLDGEGATRELDLAAGTRREIARTSPSSPGWLVDPTGRWATTGDPTFSERDPATGEIRAATRLGGCQPYFTGDGALGYWSAGAGGPIDVFDPATRESRSIVRKNDPRLPEGWRYVYFPMLSPDRSLLAYAASDGRHDHFAADYEVFVVALDPATLELTGAPERITHDPAVDRFPDVWRLAPPTTAVRPAPRPRARQETEGPAPVFVWRSATDANRASPDEDSEALDLEGGAWWDRLGRLALAGGTAATSLERGAEIDAALRATNALTLALVVEPNSVAESAAGPIAELAFSDQDRGFLLSQRGRELGFVLRRSNQFGRRGGPEWTIAGLPDGAAHHVAVTFSPGRFAAWLDGRRTTSLVAPEDFFHWRNRVLLFGAELGGPARWRGRLSQIVLWNRELDAAAIAAEAARALATVRDAPPVERLEIEARLVARSRIPKLEEISPYRQALVLEEYEALANGAAAPRRLRVARWAILDGQSVPAALRPIGSSRVLDLEPFDAQLQLESVVLSDTLPPAPGLPLWFDAALRIR